MVINVDPSSACIPALRAMWRLMREAPTATGSTNPSSALDHLPAIAILDRQTIEFADHTHDCRERHRIDGVTSRGTARRSLFNNDATLTSALLDRLLDHVETVVIEGKSYRGQSHTEI